MDQSMRHIHDKLEYKCENDKLYKLSMFLEKKSLQNNTQRETQEKGCLIDYSKIKDRDFYYEYIKGPHEGRFENINKLPKYITQSKYVSSPDFTKYTKRPAFVQLQKMLKDKKG